ncbi:hypothetical protein niasHT_035658 [Heterodera trifolii]|uniref:Uncharacterized protein n=1 Tax=Heterodera trifolii TaxID=157864 RepID=A0ABD2IXD3_9BILA
MVTPLNIERGLIGNKIGMFHHAGHSLIKPSDQLHLSPDYATNDDDLLLLTENENKTVKEEAEMPFAKIPPFWHPKRTNSSKSHAGTDNTNEWHC